MKNFKKYLCTMVAVVMLVVLAAGCGSNNNPAGSNNPSETPTGTVSESESTFFYSEGIDENGFLQGIKALEYVDVAGYKALTIPSDVHLITEDILQAEIDSMLDYFSSTNQVTDRALADGDTVNIDYVGSIDGVEFENGSTMGQGTEVTIGVTNYIDDFLQQLIGHMPGETVNVEVTFPADYHEASLQSKEALFVTTVNFIVETVKSELTDDFIKTNLYSYYGWETVNQMKEGLTKELQTEAIQNYIKDFLTNNVTVNSIPAELTGYQEKGMLQYYQDTASSYSMTLDEFLAANGLSGKDELIELNRESNTQNSTYILASQAVAEDAGISVSEDDLTEYFGDYSQYIDQYGVPYLKQIILLDKVVGYIGDNAVLE